MENSEKRYQEFLENIQEGVYETDLEGRFTYLNDAFARQLGQPKENILGHKFSEFLEEESAKNAFTAFNRLFRTKVAIKDMIWRVRTKSGEEGVVELSAHVIEDKGGNVIGFRGIARDITKSMATLALLRKSQMRYKTLLDFVPYPLVVFDNKGRVSYLNPAFEQVFGWTLEELEGKNIPYVPKHLEEETRQLLQRFIVEKTIPRYETQRLTKDGRLLDVVIRAAIVEEEDDPESFYELIILRDVTHQKKLERNNEALFKLSLALPSHPELDDLLDYISNEIKRLLEVEGAMVVLLDEEKNELYFKTGAHDDIATRKRFKEVRYSAEQGITGYVVRTGKPALVHDVHTNPYFYPGVDEKTGLHTRNMLCVPLVGKDRIIGCLCAINKEMGSFDETDLELLSSIASTVNLSIENARYAEQLREALDEVMSLNKAKDKVINHLSHELKTPIAVLGASLHLMARSLEQVPEERWRPAYERGLRNLDRLLNLQYQIEDIMRDGSYEIKKTAHDILDITKDLVLSMLEEECAAPLLVNTVRQRIDEFFSTKVIMPERIDLKDFIAQTYEHLRPRFAHRNVEISLKLEEVPPIFLPRDVIEKVFTALLKNAVENTPDNGKIEVKLNSLGKKIIVTVKDYGVGITEENKKRIFEGFFTTKDTMLYSSKNPYDFNAGGKGADLLRAKIFSERFGFGIYMDSTRCKYIPEDSDICPGDINKCSHITDLEGCIQSGGTTFYVEFPVYEQ